MRIDHIITESMVQVEIREMEMMNMEQGRASDFVSIFQFTMSQGPPCFHRPTIKYLIS